MVRVVVTQPKPHKKKRSGQGDSPENLRCGFIDKEGNVVIEPAFETAGPFQSGRAAVADEDGWHYIDRTGAVVIRDAPKTRTGPQVPRDFSEGLTVVNVDGRLGYMDTGGEIAIEPRYALAGSFSEGVALVEEPLGRSKDGLPRIRFGLIDTKGKWVNYLPHTMELGFNDLVFSEGLLRFQGDDEHRQLYGFLDRDGEWAIEPAHTNVGDFHEDRALFEYHGRWGWLDPEGEVAVDPLFDWAGDFSQGLAPAERDGKAGFIDRHGNTAIEFRYDRAASFSEGLAHVGEGDRHFYIDAQGKVAFECPFYASLDFSEGLAPFAAEV